MTRAAHRSVLAAAVVALVLLSYLPIAAAADEDDGGTSLPDIQTCFDHDPPTCLDPLTALIKGIGGLIQAGFTVVIKPILALAAGAGGLILGFLAIPGGFFAGLGQGLAGVGKAVFSGVQGFFDSAYTSAASFFTDIKLGGVAVLGPLAPIVAAATVGVIVIGAFWLVGLVFRRSDDLFPEWVEKMFKDEDDE